MGTQHTQSAAIYGRRAVAVSLFSLSTPWRPTGKK